METYQLTVKTLEGLEEVLASEIREIGGTGVESGRRAVHFTGDLAMIYRANYRLRTALRVLRQIESFRFTTADDFFLKALRIPWENHMNLNQTFVIQSTVMQSEVFRNSMFASMKLKDAIADRFRQRSGKRPDVDTSEPDVVFHLHVAGENCSISIDSSGDSLHKRGYRQSQGDAPINEVLAAGMILLTGWNGNSDFFDPMCGSGTLPIEAALIARNIPPGKFRKNFAFMTWKDFDSELFEKIKQETIPKEFGFKIHASDISAKNIISAKTNARNARIFNLISFQTSNFADIGLDLKDAVILINPPYGERLPGENLDQLYQMIGERLKHVYPGNVAWIISSSQALLNNIGLKPTSKTILFNGAMECSFQKYDLFEGKKKQLKINKKE